MSFKDIRNKGKKIFNQNRINKIIREVVLRHKQVIIDTINQEQLINKGINSLGVPISSYQNYTKATLKIKQAKGQISDRVTLDDTGKKYKQSKIKPVKGGFDTYSTVDYFPELEEKYGEEIFRMTEANTEDFVKFYVLPEIIKSNKAITG